MIYYWDMMQTKIVHNMIPITKHLKFSEKVGKHTCN